MNKFIELECITRKQGKGLVTYYVIIPVDSIISIHKGPSENRLCYKTLNSRFENREYDFLY